jgi:hypothetical protein
MLCRKLTAEDLARPKTRSLGANNKDSQDMGVGTVHIDLFNWFSSCRLMLAPMGFPGARKK